jgi:hypothetical protein
LHKKGDFIMKIYRSWGIQNENDLRPGTIGYPFKIESARIYENSVGDKNSLLLSLRKGIGKRPKCNYGLIGKNLHEEFMNDMKVSGIEELVGKKIIGFVHDSEPALQGLSVIGDI